MRLQIQQTWNQIVFVVRLSLLRLSFALLCCTFCKRNSTETDFLIYRKFEDHFALINSEKVSHNMFCDKFQTNFKRWCNYYPSYITICRNTNLWILAFQLKTQIIILVMAIGYHLWFGTYIWTDIIRTIYDGLNKTLLLYR